MKTAALILSGISLVCHTANARLGERIEECEKRYGQPVGKSGQMWRDGVVYRKDGILIEARFSYSKCVCIRFEKLPAPGQVRADAFTMKEVEILAAANSRGGKWNIGFTDEEPQVWTAGGGLWRLVWSKNQVMIGPREAVPVEVFTPKVPLEGF